MDYSQPAAAQPTAGYPQGSPYQPQPQPQQPAPAPVDPASLPPAGAIARYAYTDPYGKTGAADREQLVLVTGHDRDPVTGEYTGNVRGLVLGHADETASLPAAGLRPL